MKNAHLFDESQFYEPEPQQKSLKKATRSFYQESTGLSLTPEPFSNSSKDSLKLPEVQVEPWGTLRSIPWQSFGLSFPRQVFPGFFSAYSWGKRVSLCILRSPSSSWGLLVASAGQSGMIQSCRLFHRRWGQKNWAGPDSAPGPALKSEGRIKPAKNQNEFGPSGPLDLDPSHNLSFCLFKNECPATQRVSQTCNRIEMQAQNRLTSKQSSTPYWKKNPATSEKLVEHIVGFYWVSFSESKACLAPGVADTDMVEAAVEAPLEEAPGPGTEAIWTVIEIFIQWIKGVPCLPSQAGARLNQMTTKSTYSRMVKLNPNRPKRRRPRVGRESGPETIFLCGSHTWCCGSQWLSTERHPEDLFADSTDLRAVQVKWWLRKKIFP